MQDYKEWVCRWLGGSGAADRLAKRIFGDRDFPSGGDFEVIKARLTHLGMTEEESTPFYAGWKLYLADRDKKVRESTLESILVQEVQKRGGKCWKFTSPGTSGVPDRIVLLPNGVSVFVEMKAPGKQMRPLQQKRSEELRGLGFKVYCLDSSHDITNFIREVFRSEI